jgi:hypothetical protein
MFSPGTPKGAPVQRFLPDVVEAGGLVRLALGRRNGRQEQGGENGDDGDDDQQLKQVEPWRLGRGLVAGRVHESPGLGFLTVQSGERHACFSRSTATTGLPASPSFFRASISR